MFKQTAPLNHILNDKALHSEAVYWRRSLHRYPELLFEVPRTAAFVAGKLTEFGCDEVVTGIGRSGVVGLVRGNHGPGPTIAFRAELDALPIGEISGAKWASSVPGKMHACGHDGHMAMLLGAAKVLAASRHFKGSVAFIFQPAEEGGAGGREMVNDGLMQRFTISEVYGMHNLPGLPAGQFATRPGPVMAAGDGFTITLKGPGGHAALPHRSVDLVVVASHLVIALQAICARNADPTESLVLSVVGWDIQGGQAGNVFAHTLKLSGTVRTLQSGVRALAERRLEEISNHVAGAFGADVDVRYRRGYPATVNHATETAKSVSVLQRLFGVAAVDLDRQPLMFSEDFSFMLEARPGSFVFIGNGSSAGLHEATYDFNDSALPYGIAYWVGLAEAGAAQH